MGFLTSLFSGSTASAAEGLGKAAVNVRAAITGELPPDARVALAQLEHQAIIAQSKINEASANHPSIFVAGARPALLWVCVIGFAYAYLIYPMMQWALVLFDAAIAAPLLETDTLMSLTLALLGLSGIRGYEAIKGVKQNRILPAQKLPAVVSRDNPAATPHVVDTIRDRLKRHEGYRSKPYTDTRGKLTIGYGTNITDGISRDEAELLLDYRMNVAYADVIENIGCASTMDKTRLGVLIEMTYNMGIARLLTFRKMITALEQQDYETAAREIINSAYADQVGNRADILADIMRTGVAS